MINLIDGLNTDSYIYLNEDDISSIEESVQVKSFITMKSGKSYSILQSPQTIIGLIKNEQQKKEKKEKK